MTRAGIQFEQVAAVADALMGEGQSPTIRAVRERLGDTGSPNTIHKHLATWRQARPVAVAAASVLPQALTAAIAAEIERAAAQARGEIEGRLVQVQTEAAELAVSGEATEAERDALAEQVAALTTERDTLTGRAAQQAADLAEQARRIEREQQAAEAARVELATARLKIEAQAEARADQSAEIERLRAALEVESRGRIAAEQQAAVLAARLEAMTERTSRAEARIELIEQQAQQTAQELSSARVQVQVQQNALDTAAHEIEASRAAVKKARATDKEVAELRRRLATQPVNPGPGTDPIRS
jgi:chromosome segregation ATPase